MININEFDNWILGNRVNWLRINRHTYKLTLKPLLFDCATFALVYFDYYANRNFSLKVIHRSLYYQTTFNLCWQDLDFSGILNDCDRNFDNL